MYSNLEIYCVPATNYAYNVHTYDIYYLWLILFFYEWLVYLILYLVCINDQVILYAKNS